MKTYEFTFADGVKFSGEGNGEAEALHNAYLINGYMPFALIVDIKGGEDPGINPSVDMRKGKSIRERER